MDSSLLGFKWLILLMIMLLDGHCRASKYFQISTTCKVYSGGEQYLGCCSMTDWRFLAKLDHHWHQLSLIHQAVSVRVQNLKNDTSDLLWSISQHFFALKRFLRPEIGQSWGREQWLLPAPSDGGRPQHHEQPCAAPPCPPSFPCMPRVLHVGRG